MSAFRRGWIAWHRWTGLLLGLLLAVWTIGGIVLSAYHPPPVGPTLPFDLLRVTPADAIARARAPGDTTTPFSLRTLELAGRLTYRVGFPGRPGVLVDAATGDVVTIDSSRAVAIARFGWSTSRVERVRLVDEHTALNPSGPLPVWLVELRNPTQRVFVRPADGSTRPVRSFAGWREWMVEMHTLSPLRVLRGGTRAQGPVAWLAGLAGLTMTISGYVLVWWPGRRRRRRGKT